MKSYETCPKAVADRVAALIRKFHPDLLKCKVAVDLLFVSTDAAGPALSLHGYACAAIVRALGAKDRAAGRGDAEIVIDRAGYETMTEPQRDALLDHELYHLTVARDRSQRYKVDGEGRPVLKLRKHDREFGWFDEIARRHADNSMEIRQARQLITQQGQLYFNLDPASAPFNPLITEAAAAEFGRTVASHAREAGVQDVNVSIHHNGQKIFDTAPLSAELTQAVAAIRDTGKASTSVIQRRLRLGYNRAAALLEELQRLGVVGPEQGSAPRQILVDLSTVKLPAATAAA